MSIISIVRKPSFLLRSLSLAAVAASLSACVPVLIVGGATGAAVGLKQERSIGSGFDDVTTDANIRRLLFEAEGKNFGDVDVTVYEGRVLLTGTVPRDADRIEATKIAHNGGGVIEVLNELAVTGNTGVVQGTEDALIDTRLRAKLTSDRRITSVNYEIVVSQGVVYLIGIATDSRELTYATDHARTLPGVKKVVSHVRLKSDPGRMSAY